MSLLLNVWEFFRKLRKKKPESAKTNIPTSFRKFENLLKSSEVFGNLRKNRKMSQCAQDDLPAVLIFLMKSSEIFGSLLTSSDLFGKFRELKMTFLLFYFFKSLEIVGSLRKSSEVLGKNQKMSESSQNNLPTIFENIRKFSEVFRSLRKCLENFGDPQKIFECNGKLTNIFITFQSDTCGLKIGF